MRTVVHLGHEEEALTVAGWIGADVRYLQEGDLLPQLRGAREVVAIMSLGILVRKLAPCLVNKWVDPAVVMITPDLRFVVPVIGGHHGANELAREISRYGPVPVISTATDVLGKVSVEALALREGLDVVNKDSTVDVNAAILKGDVPFYRIDGPAIIAVSGPASVLGRHGEYTVGIGCNRNTSRGEIVNAISLALREANIDRSQVLAYATTARKADEEGLIEAVRELDGLLLFLKDETLNSQNVSGRSRAELIGLIGVSEPAALSLSKHKELVMRRRSYGNVTVAIAR